MTVRLPVPHCSAIAALRYSLRYRQYNGQSDLGGAIEHDEWRLIQTDHTMAYLSSLPTGATFEVQVRVINANGITSTWSPTFLATVHHPDRPPIALTPPTAFRVFVWGLDSFLLEWKYAYEGVEDRRNGWRTRHCCDSRCRSLLRSGGRGRGQPCSGRQSQTMGGAQRSLHRRRAAVGPVVRDHRQGRPVADGTLGEHVADGHVAVE